MARLARALNTDALADVDLRQLAKKVRAQGRGRDTVLAHITPAEAKLLKARGGRGSINPKTGLPEFEDDFDFGGDFGGGGDFYTAPTYEYYDEPAPQQEFSGDGGGDETQTANAAVDPNLTQLGLTEYTDPGPDVLAVPGPGADPNSAEATAARAAFDTANPEVASIANANEAAGVRSDAQAAESGGGLSSLLNSLGLGGTGLSRLLGNTSNADLARLLAAGGATAAGVRAGNQAQSQGNAAANQIRDIAQNPVAAANTAQTQLGQVGDATRAAANTAQTGIQNLATDQQKKVDDAVAQIQRLADTANLRAVDIQQGLAAIAANTGLRAADIQAQYNKIASPYQTQGAELAQMGLSGGLTPAMAQAFQAAEARLAQQGIGRGGVAAAQSANQLEALRAQLLGDEYKQGLATQQIGDQYAQQGINASTAQANLADQLRNQALVAGLNQYNYANTLGTNALTTGLAGSAAANALASSAINTGLTGAREANALSVQGITAALQAAGIRDQNLIKAIEVQLQGNEAARTAMQNLFTQIGGFLGGGTGGGNTATTTARS
jgi:hypothetical protein